MGDQKSDVLDFSGTINTSYTEIKEKSKKEGLKRRKIVSVSSFKMLKELIAQSLGSNNISLTRNNILFAESPQSLLRAFCEVTINPKQKAMIIQPTLSDYSRAIKEVGGVVVN